MMTDEAFPKLKVFHFISGDLWAGAEVMAYNLLRHLKEHDDLDISVILLNEGRLAEELRAAGLTVHVIDERQDSFWGVFQKTRNIVNSCLPDIIQSHRYKENLLALLISGCLRNVKLVSTQHGLPEAYAKKPSIIQRLKISANFLILSRYFTTVAVSRDVSKALINRFGFRNERLEVIHNGIDLPEQVSTKSVAGEFVIGSSGRLFPVKDYPLMVEIARSVARTGARGIRFELAGDGPEMSALAEMIESYGIKEGFIFKGHLDDMDSFYRGLDVYINTSVHEGIPMTILEALAHGLPVVAPAVGGIVEIIEDGKEGFLIDSRNPQDFAEKCLLLKENRELREKMARAAREKAERAFSAERMADNYYRLYCQTALQTRLRCVSETNAVNRIP
jgi:glycosyltransferase involved in cell wall biosynthesis